VTFVVKLFERLRKDNRFFHLLLFSSSFASKNTMAILPRKRPEPGKHFSLFVLALIVIVIILIFLVHRNSVAPVGANPPANTYQRN
jgi:hypothetical protein